ncbi:hypothetical protein ACQPYK_17100 [Streptosporangium sp. CA-135522]|uniref:hypothetical protein n=1 Tax=Streptosporangium sp. CA-135522 TaxID=3240072 RepID=UPI003D8FFDBB
MAESSDKRRPRLTVAAEIAAVLGLLIASIAAVIAFLDYRINKEETTGKTSPPTATYSPSMLPVSRPTHTPSPKSPPPTSKASKEEKGNFYAKIDEWRYSQPEWVAPASTFVILPLLAAVLAPIKNRHLFIVAYAIVIAAYLWAIWPHVWVPQVAIPAFTTIFAIAIYLDKDTWTKVPD